MNFKQNQILMMTFVEPQFGVMSAYQFRTKASSYEDIFESQFQVMEVYGFQAKADFDEDICWASVWNYLSLGVSNNS